MHISLVICDHNDHDMVRELLHQPAVWGVPLAEAIVADDASHEPFAVPDDVSFPVRVIRSDTCLGCAMTKMRALSAATGDALLALDADIRPHANWLRHALSYVANPAVGLVGAPITPRLGGGEFSRAWHRCCKPAREDIQAGFVAGGCLLMRKNVFDTLGGVSAYEAAGKPYEDVYLSGIMRRAALGIIHAGVFPVYEVRELDRLEFCRREARYFGPTVGAVTGKYGAGRYVADMLPHFDEAIAYARTAHTPVMAYARLLGVCAVLCTALQHGLSGRAEEIMAGGQYVLRHAGRAQSLFAKDAEHLHLPSGGGASSFAAFAPLEALFAESAGEALDQWAAAHMV